MRNSKWLSQSEVDTTPPASTTEKTSEEDDRFFFPPPAPTIRVENNLYFYSEVFRESILTLNMELEKLSNTLMYSSITQGVAPTPIKLHIQSFGGNIFSGFSVMDTILSCKVPVHTIIDGCAASAASIMSIVGHKRFIKKHSYILIHQLSGGFYGTFEQQKDDMKNSEKFMKMMLGIYEKYTKLPPSKLNEILKRDLWLSSAEALKYGLVDQIL